MSCSAIFLSSRSKESHKGSTAGFDVRVLITVADGYALPLVVFAVLWTNEVDMYLDVLSNQALAEEFSCFLRIICLFRIRKSHGPVSDRNSRRACRCSLLWASCRAELQPALFSCLPVNDRNLITAPYTDNSPVECARATVHCRTTRLGRW